jgi:hypothetical protein
MSASRRILLALVGALASVLLGASAALAGPTVTVRIEGASGTLLPTTTVTLATPEPTSACAANSVAAAINLAVGGNWDHGEANGGGGDFTETILGETHAYTDNSDTWAEWINDKWGGGICTDLLGEGDEVLMVADHEPEPYAPMVLPLVLSGVPSSIAAGTPFTVHVSAVHTRPNNFPQPGEGTPQPAAGITVSGGGVTAITDANGAATITLAASGNIDLKATQAGYAPSNVAAICVHNGNDGNCGTTAPAGSPTGISGASVTPTPYSGPYALVAKLSGLREGQIYRHGHAPRVLSGSVAGHSPISAVNLELRRSYRGRCSSYDATRGRFVVARCGQGLSFKVSSTGSFSYLLPASLAPGRYVLDVYASDALGNRTTLARGTTRTVFRVG